MVTQVSGAGDTGDPGDTGDLGFCMQCLICVSLPVRKLLNAELLARCKQAF
jgi:hypothetical protein